MSAYTGAWSALKTEARRVYPPVCHVCAVPIDLTLSGARPVGLVTRPPRPRR